MKKYLVAFLFAFVVEATPCLAFNNRFTASPEKIIAAYIQAVKNSDANILKAIMHDDAFVTMPRQNAVVKHTKRQLVQFYKQENKNTLNCSASYRMVSSCDVVAIVTIDFKFETFTQRNYITIEKDQNHEWKVMSINKFFV